MKFAGLLEGLQHLQGQCGVWQIFRQDPKDLLGLLPERLYETGRREISRRFESVDNSCKRLNGIQMRSNLTPPHLLPCLVQRMNE